MLVTIRPEDLGRELSSRDKELITSATTAGALIAALVAGFIADWRGRKAAVGVSDIAFMLGAMLQVFSHNITAMTIGRFIMGLGVGMASVVIPLYIAELAPADMRGRLVILYVLCITFGQVIAFLLNLAFSNVSHGWRIMIAIGIFPAAAQTCLLAWLPETPRFLIRAGRDKEAENVISKIYPHTTDFTAEVTILREHCRGSPHVLHDILMLTKGSNAKALMITSGLQALQQLCGFNCLMYYASVLFESIGFANPIATSLLVSITNCVFTATAFMLIDRVGRRRMLLYTIPGMTGGLMLFTIAYILRPNDSGGFDSWAVAIVISIAIYVAFYALGIGNVPWQQSELFPMSLRGLGVTCATSVNWAFNLSVSASFLSLLNSPIGPPGTFSLFAILSLAGLVFVYFCYPELNGLSLEEIADLLQGANGGRRGSHV